MEDGHRRPDRRDPRPLSHGRLFAHRVPGDAGHVVAVLTILGVFAYDTVVVFDRVGENTKGFGASGRMTTGCGQPIHEPDAARSMNTSLVASCPCCRARGRRPIPGATTLQYFGWLCVTAHSGPTRRSSSPRPSWPHEGARPRYINIRQKLASRADRTASHTATAALSTVTASSRRGSTGAAAAYLGGVRNDRGGCAPVAPPGPRPPWPPTSTSPRRAVHGQRAARPAGRSGQTPRSARAPAHHASRKAKQRQGGRRH